MRSAAVLVLACVGTAAAASWHLLDSDISTTDTGVWFVLVFVRGECLLGFRVAPHRAVLGHGSRHLFCLGEVIFIFCQRERHTDSLVCPVTAIPVPLPLAPR